MAGQSITLKIAGKDYSLIAQSPEAEHFMRVAAENIRKMMESYDQKFPDKSVLDKLAFVALNETVSMLLAQRKLAKFTDEEAALEAEIESYLKTIEADR